MKLATHCANIRPVHPFPARMAPSIVWDSLPTRQSAPFRVLDPMAGSGTSLVCARSKGHEAIGCDTDPLALLICKVWCADLNQQAVTKRARIVLERAIRIERRSKDRETYPTKADKETREFIDFWFDTKSRRQLAALALAISRVRNNTERLSLWCAFSRLIITKVKGASLAMDVSHSRPHRVYTTAPIQPFSKFEESVWRVVKSNPFVSNSHKAVVKATIRLGDARHLPVSSDSIDMIITSPPYLNAIDYLRGHKLSLVWMGYSISELRRIRANNVGTEVSQRSIELGLIQEALDCMGDLRNLEHRKLGMVRRYLRDMDIVMAECSRVLKDHGKAIFVVGNSAITGVFIQNAEALVRLAEAHKLILQSKEKRLIAAARRYLPPPDSRKAGRSMQTRMREEVILTFRRS